MKLRYTIRDGIIIAAVLTSFRFALASITDWPGYSWPDVGCLFIATELFGLSDEFWVQVLSSTVAALAIGAIVAVILNAVPNLKLMKPSKFRFTLCLTETVVLLLPIVLFPVNGWI